MTEDMGVLNEDLDAPPMLLVPPEMAVSGAYRTALRLPPDGRVEARALARHDAAVFAYDVFAAENNALARDFAAMAARVPVPLFCANAPLRDRDVAPAHLAQRFNVAAYKTDCPFLLDLVQLCDVFRDSGAVEVFLNALDTPAGVIVGRIPHIGREAQAYRLVSHEIWTLLGFVLARMPDGRVLIEVGDAPLADDLERAAKLVVLGRQVSRRIGPMLGQSALGRDR